MPSPAKRRKTNKDASSNATIGSLDYFFAKQKQASSQHESEASKEDGDAQKDATITEGDVLDGADGRDIEEQDAIETDEELARRLQEEWNREAAPAESTIIQQSDESSSQQLRDQSTNGEPTQKPSPSTSKPPTSPSRTAAEPPTKGNPFLSLQSTAVGEDAVSNSIPFDESPLTFDPAKYVPDLRWSWDTESGGHATYALLTRGFVLVNQTQSRIKIVDTMTNVLRTIIEGDPESLLPAVWLATNSIAPPYEDLELGLGGSAISKALKKVCGLDSNGLRTLYHKYGDAGDVAFEAKKRQSFTLRKPKPLTIQSVHSSLVKIAKSKGTGSVETKQRIVERLVQDARGAEESRYIVRTLVQHLRIGATKTTMLIALSRAFLLSRPPEAAFPVTPQKELASMKKDALTELYTKAEEIVKACFARRPSYGDLVACLLEYGVTPDLLQHCGLTMHVPLRPMLGSITRDLHDMLTKLGSGHNRAFACEFKYDGQRAQVHCDERGRVSIFSRHLERMTDKYPDLVALVPRIRGDGVRSFVLEGEVVAIDRATGALRPFQHLANRARKEVAAAHVEIDVCLFAFDLMYLNGEELLARSFRERRNLLRSLFEEIPRHFTWVRSLDAMPEDAEKVLEFFKNATDAKCEGIMVKVLDNPPSAVAAEPQVGENGLARQQPPTTPTSKSKRGGKVKTPKGKSGVTNGVGEEPSDKTAASSGGTRRKALLATYEPDKRLESWLKVKKDYDSAAADTLDLVPVAGWHGQGRKSAWWSPVLLAVRNPESGGLEAVTKCMSGFTDKFYKDMRSKYDPDVDEVDSDDEAGSNEGADAAANTSNGEPDDLPRDRKTARTNNTLPAKPPDLLYHGPEPNVWFAPGEVWECAFADITLSPTYLAAHGLVHPERGLSLRFPRFLRVREDKGIEEASSADFLAELYRRQEERGTAIVVDMDGQGKGPQEAEEELVDDVG